MLQTMHLRSLLLFTMLLGSSALSKVYACYDKPVNDSIRKVSIRVVALEKPKEADLDSLLLSSMPAVKPRKASQKPGDIQEKSNHLSIQPEQQVKYSNNDQKQIVKSDSDEQTQAHRTDHVKTQSDEVRNAQLTDNPATFQEVKTARTYLWIGFMLIVVGIILGILFGKTALLVSIAGVVFVIIGYIIQH